MTDDATLEAWFSGEILPLEGALTRFLRRNWREQSEVFDLRQEIYANICAAAREALPRQAGPFLFATARNHLINRARRARIVSFDLVADLESRYILPDLLTPDRHLLAREELRRMQTGLNGLPTRCGEIVRLRKIDGLNTQETATRLGVSVGFVEQQLSYGMRALADYMAGGSGKVRRGSQAAQDRTKAR